MAHAGSLESGRDAVAGQAWGDAYRDLSAADAAERLDVDDLERLALSAHMTGRTDEAARTWERAYHAAIDGGQSARAVRRCLPPHHGPRPAGRVRAGRRLARPRHRGPRRGGSRRRRARLPAHPRGAPGARERRRRRPRSGCSSGWPSWPGASAIVISPPSAGSGRGQSLVTMGEVARGVAFLDEAMLAVTAGEVAPITVGTVYCAAIEAFGEIFDLRRAQEWTAALSAWCDAQPDLVPFRGRCLVYRTEIMEFHGQWRDADREAQRAEAWLSRPPIEPAVGEAHYRRAELHRLRGKHADAEAGVSRRPASGDGGRIPVSRSSGWRRATARLRPHRSGARSTRPRAWPGPGCSRRSSRSCSPPATSAAARSAAAELAVLAERSGAAAAAGARGTSRGRGAPGRRRRARGAHARCARRRPAGRSSTPRTSRRGSGSGSAGPAGSSATRDAAELEFDAARRVFAALGAAPDLGRLDRLAGEAAADRPGGLTEREIEVLRLLATGRTNRSIATDLDDQRADRRPPREQHLHEARRVDARRRDGLRLRARPRLTRRGTHAAAPARLGSPPMRSVPAPSPTFGRGDREIPRSPPTRTARGRHAMDGKHERRADRHDRHRGRTGRPVGRLPPRQARRAVRHPRCRRADRRPLAGPLGLAPALQPGPLRLAPGHALPGAVVPLADRSRDGRLPRGVRPTVRPARPEWDARRSRRADRRRLLRVDRGRRAPRRTPGHRRDRAVPAAQRPGVRR